MDTTFKEIKLNETIAVAGFYNSPSINFAKIEKETEKAIFLRNEVTFKGGWFPKSSLEWIEPYGFYTVKKTFRFLLKKQSKLNLIDVLL